MAWVDLSGPGYPGTSRGLRAYVATPTTPGPWPGIVALHEAWGLDECLRRQADYLASRGYLVVAPDLYSDGGGLRCVRQVFTAIARREGIVFHGDGHDAACPLAPPSHRDATGGDAAFGSDWGDDTLYGNCGDDKLIGGAGNDLLIGSTGWNWIYENGGYRVERTGAGWRVTDKSGADGIDTLTGVERLEFTDKSFELARPARVVVVNHDRGHARPPYVV